MLEILIENDAQQSAQEYGSRVEYSSGSRRADCETYATDAIIPAGPWVATPPEIIRDIQKGGGGRVSLSLVTIPRGFLDAFHGLFQPEETYSVPRVRSIVQTPTAKAILGAFHRFVGETYDLSRADSGLKSVGLFAVKEGNLETVTVNGANGLRTGLHVDDWSKLPLAQRIHAPYRICANFGWADRYLLFVALPLHELVTGAIPKFSTWSKECLRTEFSSGVGSSAFAKIFMQSFPSFPISRLRVRPSEAYIAPTENLIHDGSSTGSNTADVSCHIWARS